MIKKWIEIISYEKNIEDSKKTVRCKTFSQIVREIERCKKQNLSIEDIKIEKEELEIKLSTGFYRDKNLNKWDCNKFTHAEALEAYKSLTNCRKCRDCINCINCVDCIDCVNSSNCVSCINIKNGINLERKYQSEE